VGATSGGGQERPFQVKSCWSRPGRVSCQIQPRE
jgi:hypothetical protein